jgi:hypothetical protein
MLNMNILRYRKNFLKSICLIIFYKKNFQEAFFYTMKTSLKSEVYNKNTKEAWKKLVLLIAEHICKGIRKESSRQEEMKSK